MLYLYRVSINLLSAGIEKSCKKRPVEEIKPLPVVSLCDFLKLIDTQISLWQRLLYINLYIYSIMNNSFRFLSELPLLLYRICFKQKLSNIKTTLFYGKFTFKSLFKDFFIPDKDSLLKEQQEFFDPDGNPDRYDEPLSLKIPTISELVTAIELLNDCNSLIVKMYMAGMSKKEISEKLDLPQKLIEKQIATNLEILRIFLNK